MRRSDNIVKNIDWVSVLLYAILVIFGWLNIYAATYDASDSVSIFSFSNNSGKQLIFIALCIIIIVVLMIMDFRFFDTFGWIFYIIGILALFAVLFLARDINGAKSWIDLGAGLRLQPSEMTKIFTVIALAKILSSPSFKSTNLIDWVKALSVILLPVALIILQKDAGTALVFLGLIFVLYREGMTPLPLILGVVAVVMFSLSILFSTQTLLIGIGAVLVISIVFLRKSFKAIMFAVAIAVFLSGFIFSIDYLMNDVLKPHQKDRIQLVFNPNSDPLGKGWNITQSKIAIGSGGFFGKGYLNGTQTKYDFVPEQSTDFIFCTIGEEHGFIGTFFVVGLFLLLLNRIIFLAERQKWKFARAYGYGVVCILFVHFTVNIGMTMGLLPVIGIPLPFFSYGGSSLLAFTILLFAFLKMDAHRNQVLDR